MWSDNETAIDLCGFDFLVDQLELVLSKAELRPVTVGLSGDWGSGKTSLMRMTQSRLEQQESALTCTFSPWRFEDYDDIKHALMATILGELEKRVHASESLTKRVGEKLSSLRRLARTLRLPWGAAAVGATAVGADPLTAKTAGDMTQALLVGEAAPELDPFKSAAEFREDFESLLIDLGDEVSAVFVFVDDLDRCLPGTVVDTLEAIRLFVHVPKTGFVIAADPRAVRRAIESHFPGEDSRGEELGIDYLEKIWQFTVTIPPLSVPEAETFVNLLFAELELAKEDFEAVKKAADERRAKNLLSVAMNHGIAEDVLGEIPEPLAARFVLAGRIAPQLAQGLRGNPREIKRFLNTLLLRLGTAKKRGVDLEPDVLAKLMILEERHLNRFKQLFEWQLAAEGVPAQLEAAEQLAAGEEPDEAEEVPLEWREDDRLLQWLGLEPALAGKALASYFSFSRDKLSAAAPASRLSGELQSLLPSLLSESDSARAAAQSRFLELDPSEQDAVFEVLLERVTRNPTTDGLRVAGEIAKGAEPLVEPLIAAIRGIPSGSIPMPTKAQYELIFKGDSRFSELFPSPKPKRRR